MPEKKEWSAPLDIARINITDRQEVDYWTRRFSVTEEQLRNAVYKVGTLANLVEIELKSHSHGT